MEDVVNVVAVAHEVVPALLDPLGAESVVASLHSGLEVAQVVALSARKVVVALGSSPGSEGNTQ